MSVIITTQRKGTRFTVQEVTAWIARMNNTSTWGGPYHSLSDKRTNSPNDWERIIGYANAFKANTASDDYTQYFKGNPATPFPQEVNGTYDPRSAAGTRIACAAMVYLLTGDTSYGNLVVNKLIDISTGTKFSITNGVSTSAPTYSATLNPSAYSYSGQYYPAFDFTNKQRWAPQTIVDVNPGFIQCEWMQYLIWAYEMVTDLFPTAKKGAFLAWLTGAMIWAEEQATLDSYFIKKSTGNYRPSSSTLSNQLNDGAAKLLYFGGPVARKIERGYGNRRSTLMTFIGQVAIMTGNNTYLQKAITYFKEWLMFGIFSDGTYVDWLRGMNHDSDTAFDYGNFSQIITFADALQRNGLFSLYDWTTTLGSVPVDFVGNLMPTSGPHGAATINGVNYSATSLQGATTDGHTPKGIYMLVKHQCDLYNGIGTKRYATSDPTKNNTTAWQIPQPTSKNVSNTIYCLPSLYYKDPYFKATYQRLAVSPYGAQSTRNIYPAPTVDPQGQRQGWQNGNQIGTLFMFGDLEPYIYPYPTTSPGQSPQSISFPVVADMIFGDIVDLGVTVTPSGLTPSFTITGTGSGTITSGSFKATKVGTITITASQGGDASWLPATPVPRTFTINKKAVTVTVNNATRVFNKIEPTFSAVYTGFITGEDASVIDTLPTISTVASISSNVGGGTEAGGAYTINASGAVDTNYSFIYVKGLLTITKGTVTLNITTSLTVLDNASPFTVAYTVYEQGTTNSVSLTPTFSKLSGTSVASITSGGLVTLAGPGITGTSVIRGVIAVNTNYFAITNYDRNIDVALSPGKTAQAITGFNPNLTPTIGDSPATLSSAGGASGNAVTYTSSDSTVFTCTGTNGVTLTLVGVGQATVTAHQLGNGSYFDAPDVVKTITVGKKGLTITIDAQSRAYKAPNPIFTYVISGGYLVGEDINSIAVLPTINANDNSLSVPGTYVISGSGASDEKYSFTYVTANLTVTKADQTIVPITIADKTKNEAPFFVSTTSDSGLSVISTKSSGPFNISSGTITLTGSLGTCVVLFNQAGDTNYNAAPQISVSFNAIDSVLLPNQISVTNIPTVKVYGDAPFPVEATAPGGTVTITLDSGPGSWSNITGLATITGAGTLRFKFTQTGNPNYLDAIPVFVDVLVRKKSRTISFDVIPDKALSDSPLSVTATSSDGGTVFFKIGLDNGVISQVAPTIGDFLFNFAGSTSIVAYQDENDNYEAASLERVFQVENGSVDVVDVLDGLVPTFGYNPYQEIRSEYYMIYPDIPGGITGKVSHNRISIHFEAGNAIPAFKIDDFDGLAWNTIKSELTNKLEVYDITYETRTLDSQLRVTAVGRSIKNALISIKLYGINI